MTKKNTAEKNYKAPVKVIDVTHPIIACIEVWIGIEEIAYIYSSIK